MVPESRNDDARDAARLARDILTRTSAAVGAATGSANESAAAVGAATGSANESAAAVALTSAGLLDPSLPRDVRVEVLRECGRAGCELGLSLATDDLDRAAVLGGAAEALAETGMAYARDRVVFGKPLAKMPVQRYAFAAVAGQVEACVALVRRVAAGTGTPLDADSALPYALDVAWAAAEAALQVHGGYGYSDEYPVSRMWREVAAARAALAAV